MSRSVLLLHGWPGTADDFRLVRAALPPDVHVAAPDLLGFGSAFTGPLDDAEATARAHAERLLPLVRDLDRPVVAGYDIGSRVAQALARLAPEAVRALVVTPGYPGIAERALEPAAQAEFWYQHLHRLPVAEAVLDGDRRALRAYLAHFWTAWAARPGLAEGEAFERLVDLYARPGAFRASIAWYRANRAYAPEAPIAVPTTVLWGARDPLFPLAWADRLDGSFTQARLEALEDAGHFVPLEAPAAMAAAILARLD